MTKKDKLFFAFLAYIVIHSNANASVYDDKTAKCYDFWGDQLQEWVQYNGPINGDLNDIKAIIYKDQSTILSKIVRSVWAKQKYPSGYYSDHDVSRMFENASRKYAPSKCVSSIYISGEFVPGNSPWLYTKHGLNEMIREAPKRAENLGEYFGSWVFLHILINGDAQFLNSLKNEKGP